MARTFFLFHVKTKCFRTLFHDWILIRFLKDRRVYRVELVDGDWFTLSDENSNEVQKCFQHILRLLRNTKNRIISENTDWTTGKGLFQTGRKRARIRRLARIGVVRWPWGGATWVNWNTTFKNGFISKLWSFQLWFLKWIVKSGVSLTVQLVLLNSEMNCEVGMDWGVQLVLQSGDKRPNWTFHNEKRTFINERTVRGRFGLLEGPAIFRFLHAINSLFWFETRESKKFYKENSSRIRTMRMETKERILAKICRHS